MEVFEIFLILFSSYTYIKTKNLLYVFVNAFVLLYLLNVTIVTQILDLSFSPSQNKFDSINMVTLSLFVFIVIGWFSIGKIEINFDKLTKRKGTNKLDIFKGLIIIFYSIYLIYDKGFRLSGEFIDYAGQRQIYEDYIALIFLMFFISSRASKFLIFSFLIIIFSYFIAGERMRMFIYLGTIIIYLYPHRLVFIKIGLIFAYCFAEVMSLFRSQTEFGVTDNGEFISHFGSVTISSLYLNEFTSTLFFVDKLQYYIGIILGNLLPTFLLPDGFDIRGDLVGAFDIPGGGWFTVFILSVSNWYVFALTILAIFLFIRYMIKHKSLYSDYFILIVIITSPRWFMYSPYLIFRFALYSLIILFFLKTFQKIKHG